MKLLVVFALVAVAAANEYSAYDNYNVDELMANERLMINMMKCIRGAGKCTPEGLDFKKWTPDAIQNNCDQCTEKQKSLVGRVMKVAMDKVPAEWEEMNKTYNPDKKYDQALKDFLAKYGN